VETGAGAGINATDQAYLSAGATIASTAAEIFAKSEMIIKVKEPQRANGRGCAKGKFCLLFCILRLISRKQKDCWPPAAPPLPMKP